MLIVFFHYRQLYLGLFFFNTDSTMTFVIFVGGLLPYNSGKTTFVKDLLTYLTQFQSNVIPFKPLSGNNLFYNYSFLTECINSFGHVCSIDITELMKNLSINTFSPIQLNPVHRVNTQAVAHKFAEEQSLSSFFTSYSESSSLLQRFTFVEETDASLRSVYLINSLSNNNRKFLHDKSLIETIRSNAETIKEYSSESEYYNLNAQYYADSIDSSFKFLEKQASIIVVEGFNNSAHPAWCIRSADIIFLIGPGSLFVYQPDVYFRTIDGYRTINRSTPTITEEVVKMIKPTDSFFLHPEHSQRESGLHQFLDKHIAVNL